MKRIFTIVAMAFALLTAIPSQAQISFGLKGGYNVTNMSLSSDVIDKSNQTGFFVGPTVKFTLHIVGLGIDAAALYDQRDAKLKDANDSKSVSEKNINIPINVRYSFGLGDMASIYLAAGPQFGFNVGDKKFQWNNEENSYKLKDTNFSINVGAGVALVNHLEIGCTYNIACGKTGEVKWTDAVSSAASQVVSKNNRTNAWQVYLAYYF